MDGHTKGTLCKEGVQESLFIRDSQRKISELSGCLIIPIRLAIPKNAITSPMRVNMTPPKKARIGIAGWVM